MVPGRNRTATRANAALPCRKTADRGNTAEMVGRDLHALARADQDGTWGLPPRECSHEHFVRFACELATRTGTANLASRGEIEAGFVDKIVIREGRNDEQVHVEFG